jgi:hypothetical protein
LFSRKANIENKPKVHWGQIKEEKKKQTREKEKGGKKKSYKTKGLYVRDLNFVYMCVWGG